MYYITVYRIRLCYSTYINNVKNNKTKNIHRSVYTTVCYTIRLLKSNCCLLMAVRFAADPVFSHLIVLWWSWKWWGLNICGQGGVFECRRCLRKTWAYLAPQLLDILHVHTSIRIDKVYFVIYEKLIYQYCTTKNPVWSTSLPQLYLRHPILASTISILVTFPISDCCKDSLTEIHQSEARCLLSGCYSSLPTPKSDE